MLSKEEYAILYRHGVQNVILAGMKDVQLRRQRRSMYQARCQGQALQPGGLY